MTKVDFDVLSWTECEVNGNPDWVQWTVDLQAWDFETWLIGQRDHPHFFWADRDGEEELAGVGLAWQGVLPEMAPAGLRCFAALRFDAAGEVASEWADWGEGFCFAPRVLAARTQDGVRLTITKKRGENVQIAPLLIHGSPSDWPSVDAVTRQPEFAHWSEQVQAVLNAPFDKLVLARVVNVDFTDAPQAAQLLRRLRAKAEGCYHFLFCPKGEAAFIGCSPERLFSVQDGILMTEAVAGTRPAGEEEGRELLASDKDRREQHIVVQRICRQLQAYSKRLIYDEQPGLLVKRFWQHLWTPIRAELTDVKLSTLIAALHPTPAVGGEPREGAESAIRAIEGFDRGLYAGAVGWVCGADAEFAVAIRSGLLRGKRLSLYTGCGIVPGSTAQGEWDETDCKTQNFISVLS